MPDKVEFFEADHRYVVNGEEYPSVSAILAPFMDFSRVPRDVLERKRQIGRAAHRCIELGDELDIDTVDEQVQPYLESWRKFIATKPLRVLASERIVYSTRYRCAGRLDLNVEFLDNPGVYWQLDVKCVDRMMPETALQTAAYSEFWNEREQPRLTKRAGLQLRPDGSQGELYTYDRIGNKNDFNYFLNMLNANRWVRNHRRTT